MADITVDIIIPDANVAEVSAATGATTKAQFQDWVRDRVKEAVRAKRLAEAEAIETAKVQAAQDAKETAVNNAVNAVDTDIVLG